MCNIFPSRRIYVIARRTTIYRVYRVFHYRHYGFYYTKDLLIRQQNCIWLVAGCGIKTVVLWREKVVLFHSLIIFFLIYSLILVSRV